MNTPINLAANALLVCLAMTVSSQAGDTSWTRKTAMPTARFGFAAGVVNGKIYAIGGALSLTGAYYSTVEEYDPATDTWTEKTKMPTARNGLAAAVVQDKIYVVGGEPRAQASLATVEMYDPATDTWTPKANMPRKRTFLGACGVGGKLYVLGGVTAGDPAAEFCPPALDVYDPATDTWTTKGNVKTPRACAAVCALDQRLFFIGGVLGGDLHAAPVSTVEQYDPAMDTWTRKASMPTARSYPSATVLGGKIYVMGGGVWNGAIFSTVEMYDPATDTWTRQPPMAAQRWGLASGAANGRIYAIGGSGVWYPGAGMGTMEEYDPKPTVSLLRTGSTLKVYWNGILESSDAVDGASWQALNPATWPFSTNLNLAGPMKFYRAREP